MKVVNVVIIVLIGIAVYSFFNQFMEKNLPNYLELPGENQKAQQEKTLISKGSASVYNLGTQPNNVAPVEQNGEKENEERKNLGEVEISEVRDKNYYHPALITLRYRVKYGERINITGWKVSARKGEIKIPQGIEKYESHREPKDIILSGSGTIYLIADENPLGRNKNFRLNNCLGYLKEYNNFYPSFYTYCPKPKLEEISHLNPWCQEFILRLSRCEIPNYSNNLKIALDSQCISFLNDNFSYSACFENYNQDEGFLKDTWYLYTKSDIAHELHDTIYLYDQNDLLVDKYTY